ncbi:MAG: DUF6544 family protein [Anaerolineales bacterium]|nr:DUF6544 family protein [Anaerolineales bacterium]
MKIIGLVLSGIVVLMLILWLGLQVQPQGFPELAAGGKEVSRVALPDDLPAPVERFYEKVFGGEIPRIDTAVISGRGTMRIQGITMPVRWRFTHQVGKNYRHEIETTWFGIPILKVNELYMDGTGRLELPFGISEGPRIDQGANLGLWSETVWMASGWITDPRVRWEAVDADTALLIVPFEEGTQRFIVRFDPQTDLIRLMESMRYKGEESQEKILWLNQVQEWGELNQVFTPVQIALIWFDEGTPWAELSVESVQYNLEVEDVFQEKGN